MLVRFLAVLLIIRYPSIIGLNEFLEFGALVIQQLKNIQQMLPLLLKILLDFLLNDV